VQRDDVRVGVQRRQVCVVDVTLNRRRLIGRQVECRQTTPESAENARDNRADPAGADDATPLADKVKTDQSLE
jgi:hypothetical protein